MKWITATEPIHMPPLWAILERKLFDLMNEAYLPVMEKYVREDGSVLWPVKDDHTGVDALDDAYESFHNWPLFYLLGGDDVYLELSHKEFEAITRQFSRYETGFGHPMAVKEYEQGYDWFHQGEGYLFFYYLCLADPEHSKNGERARRFAGFYLNEDPDAQNYDEALKLIKCAHNGSKGPAHRNFTGYWPYEEWKAFYGLPYQDVPGCKTIEDIRDERNALAMGLVMKERMSYGDVAINMSVTGMMANAYMMTGDEKCRSWVRDYMEAWIERTERNGGIVPDNVGLSGTIGEYTRGKWYGGYYGWTWPHGWLSVGDAVVIAAQNAMLLHLEPRYLDLLRSQMDILIDRGIEKDGTLRVPYKYGDPGCYEYKLWIEGVLQEDNGAIVWRDGWFEYQPMDPRYPVHLWNMSADAEDLRRICITRNADKRDWERVLPKRTKDQGGHEGAWAAYLQGEFPDYPEKILQYNLEQVYQRLAFMRSDDQDPATYTDSYLQARNPISVEGLTQLTLGGPLPVYNGGLLISRVRYFDSDRRRPGLPEDVAALLEKAEEDHIVLHLVNLNGLQTRRLIVQAGAFGEHRFTSVTFEERLSDGRSVQRAEALNGIYAAVQLQPGSGIRMKLGMNRFVHDPSFRLPWGMLDG